MNVFYIYMAGCLVSFLMSIVALMKLQQEVTLFDCVIAVFISALSWLTAISIAIFMLVYIVQDCNFVIWRKK